MTNIESRQFQRVLHFMIGVPNWLEKHIEPPTADEALEALIYLNGRSKTGGMNEEELREKWAERLGGDDG